MRETIWNGKLKIENAGRRGRRPLQGSRKMRVAPEIFWEEETPRRRR